MRKLILLVVPAFVLMTAPATAQDAAAEDEAMLDTVPVNEAPPAEFEEEISPIYSAVGLSKVAADFDNVEDAINLDITMIGFRIPTVSWFAIELNLGFTMIPGEVTAPSSESGGACSPFDPFCTPSPGSTSSAEGDWAVTTIGALAVLRSPGKFFGTGSLGYRYLNSNLPELQENRRGNGWGAGVGYRWDRKGSFVEAGYNKYSDDLDGIGFKVSYSYERR